MTRAGCCHVCGSGPSCAVWQPRSAAQRWTPTRLAERRQPPGLGPALPLLDPVQDKVLVGSGRDAEVSGCLRPRLAEAANLTVTKAVYRHQIADEITSVATAMDAIFGEARGS
jgi:hypothetical protein